MPASVRVFAISGSLRKASYNTGLLRAARDVAPQGMVIDVHPGLGDIPPYDEDVRVAGYPAAVADLREKVVLADALLFASPEFNRGMSGVLKNAIDWLSRLPGPPLLGKPACVMTAATGALAGSLANYDMRRVLSVCGAFVLPGREIMVGDARNKFDGEGNLTDASIREFIETHLNSLKSFVDRHRI